jgi:hypothetical protein
VRRLAVAVDDAAALEVVRRELDPDPVARIDADPVAAHLACGVAERLVTVVERDAELAVPKRLDDLAFELDLLFLDSDNVSPRRRAEKRVCS